MSVMSIMKPMKYMELIEYMTFMTLVKYAFIKVTYFINILHSNQKQIWMMKQLTQYATHY